MKRSVQRAALGFLFTIMVAWLLTACASQPEEPLFTSPQESISVQLSWTPDVEFVGFYLAQTQGYYTEENLNVDVRGGGFDAEGNYINPLDEVLSGRADFGVFDGAQLLAARVNGAPLVAIASIYQRHPLALTSLASKNITRPQDLIGATVHVSQTSELVYRALLQTQGIDPSQVNTVPRTDFTINLLTSGEADVIDSWITNEGVDLTLAGYDTNIILLADYGILVYPDVIFTTEEMITTRPDVVQRFLTATLRGLQAAIADPELAADAVIAQDASLDREIELEAMRRSVPLIRPPDSKVGMMQPEVWEFTQQMLLDQNIISSPVDLDQAYTLAFLEEFYGE